MEAVAPGSGITRRDFLRVSAMAGGGLLAACSFAPDSEPVASERSRNDPPPGDPAAPPAVEGQPWQPNAYIRITPDNRVTVIVGSTEVGQGTLTAVPMLVAEELDADWALVGWEQSPTAQVYANPRLFMQLTAQSATISGQYRPQRRAGAAIREMLVKAAAQRWGVAEAALRTGASHVIHDASERRASYGELATEAAALRVPFNPQLKNPADFRIIGQSKRRLDGAQKTDGSARFGFDVYIPDLLTALVARPPQFNGSAKSFNAAAVLALPGVVGVHQIPSGVAVVARDFWAAKQGRDALQVEWDNQNAETLSSEAQQADYLERMDRPGLLVRSRGSVVLAEAVAAQKLSADFHFPYLAHAPMEPLNVVIDYCGDRCEIWCGTQWPDGERRVAASVLGLNADSVQVNTMLAGGGFGRRACPSHDFVREAAEVAKLVRAPVKLVWTREDDIRGGYYRPAAVCRLTATLNARGQLSSWSHRIATQALAQIGLAEEFVNLAGGESGSAKGAENLPYAVPAFRVDVHTMYSRVPVLWMRSVSNSFNVFAVETFIDEVAVAAGQDPYQFRRELLQGEPRLLGVLDAVAQASGWSAPLPPGIHRGIAVFSSYGSYIAQVVEASVGAERALRVHRVVSAVDCGIAVNPDLVAAQMESGIVFALTSALFGEITLEDGVVQQGNFHDYPLLRMYQTPQIETVFVNSGNDPGGVGELGVPCVAPALANAIFRATGERLRSLPLRKLLRID